MPSRWGAELAFCWWFGHGIVDKETNFWRNRVVPHCSPAGFLEALPDELLPPSQFGRRRVRST
jgi:hypothetical protein